LDTVTLADYGLLPPCLRFTHDVTITSARLGSDGRLTLSGWLLSQLDCASLAWRTRNLFFRDQNSRMIFMCQWSVRLGYRARFYVRPLYSLNDDNISLKFTSPAPIFSMISAASCIHLPFSERAGMQAALSN